MGIDQADLTWEGLLARLNEAEAEVNRLTKENAELQSIFDIRWKADMRAIKRWQEAHPGSERMWPDHADLVVWLMGELHNRA